MSRPPVLGRKRRIGRKAGSVIATSVLQIVRTTSLRALTTLKAISHDMTAATMITNL